MSNSYEPALRRLDRWQYNRVSQNYTERSAFVIMERVIQRLRQDPELTKHISRELLSEFSRESVVNEAQSFWTEKYHQMEKLSEGKRVEGFSINDLSSGAREEYVSPYFEHFGKLRGFIDKIREQVVPNQDLPDKTIDSTFLAHFQGLEGFIEFNRKSLKNVPLLLQGIDPNLAREYSERIKLNEAIGDVQPIYYNIIFQDLRTDPFAI